MALPDEVMRLLSTHTTMTLSTVETDGTPAAAPLFYVLFHDALLFLSDPSTRHVQNLLASPQVAIAVYQDGQAWDSIRGLQARGRAVPLPREQEAAARSTYVRRFPFLRRVEGTPLASAVARARWYLVHLEWIRLVDNTRGFGWKAEWQWNGREWERIR